MITINVLKRCTDNLAQRRLQTAADHARADAPARQLGIDPWQPTHSITVSIIDPSNRCLPAK